MFKWLKDLFKSKEEIEEEKKNKELQEKVYGKREGNRITYNNGCYSIVSGRGEFERLTLYTKDGKEIGKYETDEVHDWHHGFVMTCFRYSMMEFYYDCVGNGIVDGCGVFITDKEIAGEKLYIIPVRNGEKYILYNHETRKFVTTYKDEDYLMFDGIKADGEKIIGTVSGICTCTGYGISKDCVYHDEEYTIDRDGNVIDMWKVNTRKTEKLEENGDE